MAGGSQLGSEDFVLRYIAQNTLRAPRAKPYSEDIAKERAMLLSGLLDPQTQMPRTRMFWAVLGALIFGQIVALWALCSHQVRKAEARHTEVQVQQMALADCLRYIPGATIATCTSRSAESGLQTAVMGAPRAPSGVMPVGFSR